MADDAQIGRLDEKIAFLEGEVRGVERDRRWANRVPWLLVVACPVGLASSWMWGIAIVVCVMTLWFMALYILKFRREEYLGEIRDLRAEADRLRAAP